jgi:hypothetical protein
MSKHKRKNNVRGMCHFYYLLSCFPCFEKKLRMLVDHLVLFNTIFAFCYLCCNRILSAITS